MQRAIMMSNDLRLWLSDPARLRALTQSIRAKIPASDVQDVVQSTLADALTAAEPPTDEAAFERWLYGIARHKIADHYRRSRRNQVLDGDAAALDDSAAHNPESARDLLRWVDQELPQEPETTRTLEWMMREASGDRLEAIAQEHELSAPAVRQRVSRLRRFLRERWALQLAAALGLVVVVTGLFAYRQQRPRPTIAPDVARLEPSPSERARPLREHALTACRAGEWKPCLEELDRAKALDPDGDSASDVQGARIGAGRALEAAPTLESAPAPVPELNTKQRKSAPETVPLKTAPLKTAPQPKVAPQKQAPQTLKVNDLKKNNLEKNTFLQNDFDPDQVPAKSAPPRKAVQTKAKSVEQSETSSSPVPQKK